jgi:hypothetical protein
MLVTLLQLLAIAPHALHLFFAQPLLAVMKAPAKQVAPQQEQAPIKTASASSLLTYRPVDAQDQYSLQKAIANSPRQVAQRQMADQIANSPRQVAQRQRAGQPAVYPNRTGLPDKLKAGAEALSGHSLDDVRVHYNSAKPAQMQALAYAQGSEIHVAAGQEKHLPHEAWHVVQQKQGRVRATRQLKGIGVNDSVALEQEATVMGQRASAGPVTQPANLAHVALAGHALPVQRVLRYIKLDTRQTGDITHVAAALVHDPDLEVVISYGQKENRAKAKEMARVLNVSAVSESGKTRVWVVPNWEQDEYYNKEATKAPGEATSIVAKAYEDGKANPEAFFHKNEEGMKHKRLSDDDIIKFIDAITGGKLNLGRKDSTPYLLVWARYSGKIAGHNPAGDSSKAGNRQLIAEVAQKSGRIPITIGHDPVSNVGPTPQNLPHAAIHLGEFWTRTEGGVKNPFLGMGREAQINFYALLRKSTDVVQLGQKTGGMDGAALVGVRTIYLEDAASESRDRMKKWTDVMPHYQGVETELPPKRLGKYIRDIQAADNATFATAQSMVAQMPGLRRLGMDTHYQDVSSHNSIPADVTKEHKAATWHKPAEAGPPESKHYTAGYSRSDLEKIVAKLNTPPFANAHANAPVAAAAAAAAAASPSYSLTEELPTHLLASASPSAYAAAPMSDATTTAAAAPASKQAEKRKKPAEDSASMRMDIEHNTLLTQVLEDSITPDADKDEPNKKKQKPTNPEEQMK